MAYYNYAYQWEGDTAQPYPVNYSWKSKKFLFTRRMTFNCARIIADTNDRQTYYDSLETYKANIARNHARISGGMVGGSVGEEPIGNNIEVNGDDLADVTAVGAYSGDYNLTVKFYVDGALVLNKEVYSSDVPFRIPGGVRGRTFEVQIEGNVHVRRFDMASSMKELMGG